MSPHGGSKFQATQVVRPRKQVEHQIKQAILVGEFAQGDKLPSENELAEMFGVSRPTVREALQSLAVAGLIHKIPGAGGGSFVKSVNHESLGRMLYDAMSNILRLGTLDLGEVMNVRRLLDIPVARMAAERRSDEDLESIRAVLNEQRSISLSDPEVPLLDASFHSAIAEASGNRLLAAFASALHQVTRPAQYLKLSDDVARSTLRQHNAVLRAIEARDPDAAEKAMEQHLDYVGRFTIADAPEP
jgi:DNA-binding FadR family transcriptional regulator